jgi:rod shape-determining protein MreC
LGGGFPAGYPVAVVDKFEARPDKSFANIYATPKARLDTSREFLIVWSDTNPVVLEQPGQGQKQAQPQEQEQIAPQSPKNPQKVKGQVKHAGQ